MRATYIPSGRATYIPSGLATIQRLARESEGRGIDFFFVADSPEGSLVAADRILAAHARCMAYLVVAEDYLAERFSSGMQAVHGLIKGLPRRVGVALRGPSGGDGSLLDPGRMRSMVAQLAAALDVGSALGECSRILIWARSYGEVQTMSSVDVPIVDVMATADARGEGDVSLGAEQIGGIVLPTPLDDEDCTGERLVDGDSFRGQFERCIKDLVPATGHRRFDWPDGRSDDKQPDGVSVRNCVLSICDVGDNDLRGIFRCPDTLTKRR